MAVKYPGKTYKKKAGTEDALQIYVNQIKSYPLLELEEEQKLARLFRQGNVSALHKLINANLRLVVKIAHSYVAKDVSFMDLIQEGKMGLMHAAEKYDPSKNIRFCTYAGWWIRQYVIRYLTSKRRIVRLPHRKEEIYRRVQRTYHTLSQTLMHQPRTEEIASELGLPVKDVDFIVNLCSGTLPLELDISKGQGTALLEIHEDYTYSPESTVFKKYYCEGARNFLNRLKDKEKQVLSYRYELDEGQPHTLKEIGRKMDLSPETVRQIEMRALAKIRSHTDEIHRFGFPEAI